MRVFSDVFDHHRNLIAKDKVLVVEGVLGFDDYSGGQQLTADKIYDISQAREIFARRVVIEVDAERAGNGFVQSLADTLRPSARASVRCGSATAISRPRPARARQGLECASGRRVDPPPARTGRAGRVVVEYR